MFSFTCEYSRCTFDRFLGSHGVIICDSTTRLISVLSAEHQYNSRGAQRYVGFFLYCALWMLIGWAGKLRSHGGRILAAKCWLVPTPFLAGKARERGGD